MSRSARLVLSGLGQTLMTLGFVVILFVVYELWVTGLVTSRAQDRLADELARTWDRPVVAVDPSTRSPAAAPLDEQPLGSAWARLRVPALELTAVVVEGVTVEDLKDGPGHWPQTPEAGEVGNVVLSGHRTTYGAPFNRLDELQPGDALVVETRDAWHTYRLTATVIVDPTQVEVAFPVPGVAGAAPTQAMLTLTTCHPEYSARQRLVVHALLDESLPKAAGRVPDSLVGLI